MATIHEELVELAKFAVDIITTLSEKEKRGWRKISRARQSKSKKIWPYIYLLYLRLDRVIYASELLFTHYLPLPLTEPFLVGTKYFDSPTEKWVHITNEDFSKLTQLVKEFVRELKRTLFLVIIGQDISKHDKHLQEQIRYLYHICLSGWFDLFDDQYMSGEVQPDGQTIKRKWLVMTNPNPDIEYDWDCKELENAVVTELLDINTREKRLDVIEVGKNNLEILKKQHDKLAKFIRRYCRIEDLV